MIGTEWHLNIMNVLIVTCLECIVLHVHLMLHVLVVVDRAREHPWLLVYDSHSCLDRLHSCHEMLLIICIHLLVVPYNVLGTCNTDLRVVPASRRV